MKVFLSLAIIALVIAGLVLAWNDDKESGVLCFLVAYVLSNEVRFMSIEEKINKDGGK